MQSSGDGGTLSGILPRTMLLKARQIDQLVARWVSSSDVMERRDLITQCENLIKEGNDDISSKGAVNSEQIKAVNVFREAVRYYNKICK